MSQCRECGGQGSWYGMAPHRHDMKRTGSIIGSTVLEPKETWPDNFTPDPEEWGAGVYTCKHCGGTGVDPSEPHGGRADRAVGQSPVSRVYYNRQENT